MAFPSSPGYTNLPNGNFSPTIYSKKVIKAFRKASIAEDITNTDYAGDIANYGDTVQIIQEPDVTVVAYTRGKQLTATPLQDDAISMTIDQSNAFMFAVDDIEKKHSHVSFQDLATSRAAYKLKNTFDADILDYIHDNVGSSTTANRYGNYDSSGNLIDCGFESGEISPLQVMNRLKRMLDVQDVPEDNRWLVASPYFWELVNDENSKLLNHDYTSSNESLLRNGRVSTGMIRGFKCYQTNNAPTGDVGGTTWYGILAGHMSAVATASQLARVESFRSQDFFGDVVRGMHLYGRKLLRSEALVASYIKID
jgi:hypothetical protein